MTQLSPFIQAKKLVSPQHQLSGNQEGTLPRSEREHDACYGVITQMFEMFSDSVHNTLQLLCFNWFESMKKNHLNVEIQGFCLTGTVWR